MAIQIKNSSQIALMRKSGLIVAKTLEMIEAKLCVGMTTNEIDKLVFDFIVANGGYPSFKGYNGFPSSACVSVNEEVIHGIPGLKKILDGDIVSIDVGVVLNGFHGDAARTFCVGNVSPEARKLVEVTKQSFFEGIKYARAGRHLHEISEAIQVYVESNGFSVVRDFVGHGVGAKLHEEPQIPHYRVKSRGPRLVSGMTLAIEPMVNMGAFHVKVLSDDWTVVTKDGKLSAHYENTILITETGCELLTLNNDY